MSRCSLILPVLFLVTVNVISDDCGRPTPRRILLIHNGTQSRLGQWPWHVAVFQRTNLAEEKYACGGTIITRSYILTAAHCTFTPTKKRMLNPADILIRAGISNLRQPEWYSLQQMPVAEIVTHKDYHTVTSENDIALLKLDGKLNFTDYVKPICLWGFRADEKWIVGKLGYVAGWGSNEHGKLPDQLQHIVVPIVSRDMCRASDSKFYTGYLFDGKTFCAGSRNGTSPGAGDSGGGLFVEHNGRWSLRGIVSSGKFNAATRQLDTFEYVVFTDVAYFLSWINEKTTLSDCGRRTAVLSLENQERELRLGEWPWLAAIMQRMIETSFEHICGGTIITSSYILTTARCMYASDELLKTSEILIRTGITNFRQLEQYSLQQKSVADIAIHEDYHPSSVDHNIALLELDGKLNFTDHVKPICLWRDQADEELIVDKLGYIAGWLINEHGEYSDQSKQNRMLIVSRRKCRARAPGTYARFLFDHRNFCAGFHNESSFEVYYGGAGLYVEHDGRWTIVGMFNFARANLTTRQFYTTEYVGFTNVTYYVPWINNKTVPQNTKSIVPDNCGYRKDLPPLPAIMKNESFPRLGEWPWHVAVMRVKNDTFVSYTCGGTIITSTYILTAAAYMYSHTLQRHLKPSEMFIATGINLEQSEYTYVMAITVHEDFLDDSPGENDIALLKLLEQLIFTDFVKPICLWRDRADEQLVVDTVGYIAGWGPDHLRQYWGQLKHAGIRIVSRRKCRDRSPDFYSTFLFENHSFCASFHNGTTPVKGLMGGGLYIEHDGRWTLRGITNVLLLNETTRQFDTSHYIVFTNVAYFLPWIDSKIGCETDKIV